jgi:hypothetical protein
MVIVDQQDAPKVINADKNTLCLLIGRHLEVFEQF